MDAFEKDKQILKDNIIYYQQHMGSMLINHGLSIEQAAHVVDLLRELMPWTRKTLMGMFEGRQMPNEYDPKEHWDNYPTVYKPYLDNDERLTRSGLKFKDVGIKVRIP